MQLGCRLDLRGFEKMWLAVETEHEVYMEGFKRGFLVALTSCG